MSIIFELEQKYHKRLYSLVVFDDNGDKIYEKIKKEPTNRQKVKWECLECDTGVKETNYQLFKKPCPKCSKKVDMEEFLNDILKKSNKMIMGKYINGKFIEFESNKDGKFSPPVSRDTIRFKCIKCDNITKKGKFSDCIKSKNCKKCKIIRKSSDYDNIRTSYEEAKDKLRENGWKLLTSKKDFPKSMDIKIQMQCPFGHISEKTYNTFQQCIKNNNKSKGCKICASKNYLVTSREGGWDEICDSFLERGLTLLEEKENYKSNKEPLKYKCKCGNISQISYSNLKKNKTGCNNCSIKNRSVDFDRLKAYFEKCGCVPLISEDEYKNNTQNFDFICVCGTKDICSWKSFCKGKRCGNCKKRKLEKTLSEKYSQKDENGGTIEFFGNIFQYTYAKEKSKETNLRKRGVSHHMKTDECKEKMIKTNKENHGGIFNLNIPETRTLAEQALFEFWKDLSRVEEAREKQKLSCRKNLGVDFPLQSIFIKKKIKELYGHEVYTQSDIYKKHLFETYGVYHDMQRPEIFSKAMKSSFSKKEYKFPSGKIVYVQGYEPFALDYLLKKKNIPEELIEVETDKIPYIDYIFEGKHKRYFPDIHIPMWKILIEVKSLYTFDIQKDLNLAKFKACYDAGYKHVCWIFDRKGNLVDEIKSENFRIGYKEIVFIKN